MAESMLEKEIEVYSEKYNIHGIIRDYGIVTKLFFTYDDKEIFSTYRDGRPIGGERFVWIDTVEKKWAFAEG